MTEYLKIELSPDELRLLIRAAEALRPDVEKISDSDKLVNLVSYFEGELGTL